MHDDEFDAAQVAADTAEKNLVAAMAAKASAEKDGDRNAWEKAQQDVSWCQSQVRLANEALARISQKKTEDENAIDDAELAELHDQVGPDSFFDEADAFARAMLPHVLRASELAARVVDRASERWSLQSRARTLRTKRGANITLDVERTADEFLTVVGARIAQLARAQTGFELAPLPPLAEPFVFRKRDPLSQERGEIAVPVTMCERSKAANASWREAVDRFRSNVDVEVTAPATEEHANAIQ